MARAVEQGPPAVLRLLADPIRWRLVGALAVSDLRVGELCAALDAPQNLVSYHLGQLRRHGMVRARRSSADRRDVYYRLDVERCRALLGDAAAALQQAPASGPRGGRRRSARVLFVCTGNSSRSQIAEALLAARCGTRAVARSAGTHPRPVHPAAVEVMARRGIDISNQRTKHIRRFSRSEFSHVVTLCDKVRREGPELAGRPELRHWSIPDPAAEPDAHSLAPFERAAAELDGRVALLASEILTPPEGSPHAA